MSQAGVEFGLSRVRNFALVVDGPAKSKFIYLLIHGAKCAGIFFLKKWLRSDCKAHVSTHVRFWVWEYISRSVSLVATVQVRLVCIRPCPVLVLRLRFHCPLLQIHLQAQDSQGSTIATPLSNSSLSTTDLARTLW